ncbi:MAG: hypothetical protein M3N17_10000 [Actinomycetota bacterium]|nr:hypothetical protein [Actinomycetota bacterium]
MDARFLVARNPDAGSRLPYLLRLPIDGGLVLKARAAWPVTTRVFCQQVDEPWPTDAEVVEDLAVRSCRRRGVAIDLVLERRRRSRSQFVFTRLRGGRPAVFWQTSSAARGARPGMRVPTRRSWGREDLVIAADTRERYAYRFTTQRASVERRALRAGDYAILGDDEEPLAVVERKSVANLVVDLVDGSLAFQLAELAEAPLAAVVVEGRYADLLDLEHVQPGFALDLLARVQVRYPAVPIVFAGSRKLAEEYTFRLLGAVHAERVE